MLAPVIRDRLTAPEFRPFALVLASGERLQVRHRDSLAIPSTIAGGRRIYSPYAVLVHTEDDVVETRSISLPLIAQVIDDDSVPGARASA
jgi:hypothetical protein